MSSQRKEFITLLEKLSRTRSIQESLSDFLRMASCSLRNAYPKHKSEEVESYYLQVAKKYSKDELSIFARLLSLTILGLEETTHDFFGPVFEEMSASSRMGQFFTPPTIATLMAKLNYSDVPEYGIIKVSEPAVGAGVMIIELMRFLKEDRKVNYQHRCYVDAWDLSEDAFRMAYIQFSLLGIPATLTWGNTLTLEKYAVWHTPFYFFAEIETRLHLEAQLEQIQNLFPAQKLTKVSNKPEKEEHLIERTVEIFAEDQTGQFQLFDMEAS